MYISAILDREVICFTGDTFWFCVLPNREVFLRLSFWLRDCEFIYKCSSLSIFFVSLSSTSFFRVARTPV